MARAVLRSELQTGQLPAAARASRGQQAKRARQHFL